jgi:hypothetical protein
VLKRASRLEQLDADVVKPVERMSNQWSYFVPIQSTVACPEGRNRDRSDSKLLYDAEQIWQPVRDIAQTR